jgi:hypothetical protein
VEVLEKRTDTVVLRVTQDELILLNNALNEIVNGLDIEEFATRVGASRDEAEALRAQIHALL